MDDDHGVDENRMLELHRALQKGCVSTQLTANKSSTSHLVGQVGNGISGQDLIVPACTWVCRGQCVDTFLTFTTDVLLHPQEVCQCAFQMHSESHPPR